MKNEMTQEYLRSILNYNPDDGTFVWIARLSNRVKVGTVAGNIGTNGYSYIRINCKLYYAHRLAWLYMTGKWPEDEIDHIDMNRANNKWVNIRNANRSQNMGNQQKNSANKSGIKGVCWNRLTSKFEATIGFGGKSIYLGLYLTKEEAAAAYEKAAKELFGEYARTE